MGLVVSLAWLVLVPMLLGVFLATLAGGATYAAFGVILATGWYAVAQGLRSEGVRAPVLPTLLYASLFVWLAASTFHAFLVLPAAGSEPQFRPLIALVLWTSVLIIAPQLLRSEADLRVLFRVLHITGVCIAASVWLGIFGFGFGEVLEFRTGEVRAFGPLGDQVGFALALFALLALAKRSWITLAFQLGALLGTGTRSALLVFVFGVLVLAVLEKGRGFGARSVLRVVWIVLGALILVAVLLATPVGQDFVSRVVDPGPLLATIAQRAGSVMMGVDMFLDRPWVGAGFNGFAALAWSYDPRLYFVIFRPSFVSNAGNQWIQLAVEGGVVAVILFATFTLVMLRRQWLAARNALLSLAPSLRAIAAWSVAFVCANQTACWVIPNSLPNYYWFLMFGVANAALALPTDKPQAQTDACP
jgi:O-antigen ligase